MAIVAIIAGILAVLLWLHHRAKRALPNGPKGLPIIGNSLQMNSKKPHLILTEWSKKYGEVFTIKLMGTNVVVANSEEAIREMLIQKSADFGGRPYSIRVKFSMNYVDDITFTGYNTRCALKKKATLQALKNFGEGLAKHDEIFSEITQNLLDEYSSKKGEAFDPMPALLHAVIHSILATVFGRKFEEKDVNFFVNVDKALCEMDLFPWLTKSPLKIFDEFMLLTKRVSDWFYTQMKLQTSCLDLNIVQNTADYLLTLTNADQKPLISDDEVDRIARDMVFAGMQTTTRTLYALLGLWVKHQDVQKRAREEVDQVIGNRQPKYTDKQNLPFIESMTLELWRYMSQAPLAVPHEAMVDSTLRGHPIPKGTQVWCNLWNLHHSDTYWEDPWQFKPDRFLDSEGKVLPLTHPMRKRLMPFGAGRRMCLGESVAKHRLFMFVTSLLQKFEFQPGDVEDMPATDPRDYVLNLVLCPPKFKARLIPRT